MSPNAEKSSCLSPRTSPSPKRKLRPNPSRSLKQRDDLKSLPMPELQKKLGSSPDGLSAGRGTETADTIRP